MKALAKKKNQLEHKKKEAKHNSSLDGINKE